MFSTRKIYQHYAYKPVKKWINRRVQADRFNARFKPTGLWFSKDSEANSWRQWCKQEEFCDTDSCEKWNIRFHKDANLLIIADMDDIKAFDTKYRIHDKNNLNTYDLYGAFDWRAVARKYDGIVMSPYHYDYRLTSELADYYWYSSYDVNGGCVWNLRAVKSLEKVSDVDSQEV